MRLERCLRCEKGIMLGEGEERSCLACGFVASKPSDWAIQVQQSGRRPARETLPAHPSPRKMPKVGIEELAELMRRGVQLRLKAVREQG